MPENKSTYETVEKILKDRTILFAIDGVEGGRSACDVSLYGALNSIFGRVVLFNPRKYIFDLGREKTTELFLNTVELECPDFFFFFPARDSTGFLTLETIRKINHESPETKTVALFGDDDRDFDFFSRFVVIFVDYALVAQYNYLSQYDKEGSGSKVFPVHVADSDLFKPLAVEKKQDVVFIGKPNDDRITWLRFLIKNRINVKIYGYNWSDYPEFKRFYCGVAKNDELIQIINESRINLSFSRSDAGKLHYKGRVFEVAECKAFQLVEYFNGYLNFFNNDEIVMFKDEQDLLKKIKYYLKHDDEREKIAARAYEKVVKNYDLKAELTQFFCKAVERHSSYRVVPVVKNKVVSLNKELLKKSAGEIREIVGDSNYVSFVDSDDEIFEFKNVIQIHALVQTGKNISCCGYYVSSKSLEDYLLFRCNLFVNYDDFNKALDVTQLLVSRDYFLKNIELFKDFCAGKKVSIVNKDNTAFVDIPLYRTERLKKSASYRIMSGVFKGGCLFLMKLNALINSGKFFDSYLFKLLFGPLLAGNTFVLKHLCVSVFDRRYLNRLFGNKKNFMEL